MASAGVRTEPADTASHLGTPDASNTTILPPLLLTSATTSAFSPTCASPIPSEVMGAVGASMFRRAWGIPPMYTTVSSPVDIQEMPDGLAPGRVSISSSAARAPAAEHAPMLAILFSGIWW